MRGSVWIDPKHAVAKTTRMDVDVEVRNFLIRACACGMPDAQSVVRKNGVDRTSNLGDRRHDGARDAFVGVANVYDVTSRNDENMPGMKLSLIDKGDRFVVCVNNGRRQLPCDDVAEWASGAAQAIASVAVISSSGQ
jgi:hypothetical protein